MTESKLHLHRQADDNRHMMIARPPSETIDLHKEDPYYAPHPVMCEVIFAARLALSMRGLWWL